MEKSPDAFRTISEVADDLDVPQHVLRFWETRFREIKPLKRGGGRRYYRPDDVSLLRGIRHLLYGEGYTIRGVQRILREQGSPFVQNVWRPGAPQPSPAAAPADPEPEEIVEEAIAGAADEDEAAFEDMDVVREPVRIEPEVYTPAAASAADDEPAGLAPGDVLKLQAALKELGECRRILEAALSAPE